VIVTSLTGWWTLTGWPWRRPRPTSGISWRQAGRIPRSEFNEIFAGLPSHRDRALVAFYVSTGARASELLSATLAGIDPGQQLITVVRKGIRELQELPASTGAFVWLRLYQVEMAELIPRGRRQPLWWATRRPARPLTYHAAHRMFERVNARVGTAATLHSLRHTAAYRMAEDPALPLTDVQLILSQSRPQVPLAEDQHPVGELSPDGENEPLRIGIRLRAPRRDLHDLDTSLGQDRVEGRGELPGPVPDQESEGRGAITKWSASEVPRGYQAAASAAG
jgi:hypothetical protein